MVGLMPSIEKTDNPAGTLTLEQRHSRVVATLTLISEGDNKWRCLLYVYLSGSDTDEVFGKYNGCSAIQLHGPI